MGKGKFWVFSQCYKVYFLLLLKGLLGLVGFAYWRCTISLFFSNCSYVVSTPLSLSSDPGFDGSRKAGDSVSLKNPKVDIAQCKEQPSVKSPTLPKNISREEATKKEDLEMAEEDCDKAEVVLLEESKQRRVAVAKTVSSEDENDKVKDATVNKRKTGGKDAPKKK